jgi:hypothetical protein
MNYKVKYIVISALLTINSLISTSVSGVESDTQPATKTVQLTKAAKGDILRANLYAGDDLILKVNVDLEKGRQTYVGQEDMLFPSRIFWTDGENNPLENASEDFSVSCHCTSTQPQLVVPKEKPESFESFEDYSLWLNKAYFTNQVTITVDVTKFEIEGSFYSNVTDKLPSDSPRIFHIKGSYVIDNTHIKPDQCLPTVNYLSNRDLKVTTLTLGGSLVLDGNSYAVDGFQQLQPHEVVKEEELGFNNTRKIICSRWIASSTDFVAKQYQDFPPKLMNLWPNAPTGLYWVKLHRPYDLKQIKSFSCYKNELMLPDQYRRIFIADNVEETESEKNAYITLKVMDEDGEKYTISYVIDKRPKEENRINKGNIIGYELACQMFLPGRLEYDPETNKIKLVNDRFAEITGTGVAG